MGTGEARGGIFGAGIYSAHPGEAGGIRGRDSAIELVEDFLLRPEQADGRPHSRSTPVLVFTGARGTGKSALLGELARHANQQFLFAQVDCEQVPSSSGRDLLAGLVFELTRRCGDYVKLGFPRFVTGRLALTLDLDLSSRERARAQVEKALEEHRNVDKLRDFLGELASEVLPAVPGPDRVPGMGTAGQYLPGVVLDGLVSRRWGRRVVLGSGQDWYGHQDRGLARNALDELVDLSRQANHPSAGDAQRDVDETLWAAFLADLRSAFRSGRSAVRCTFNCAVLVDNIDSPAGMAFVEELLQARSNHAAHVSGGADPLTVVATTRAGRSRRFSGSDEPVRTVAKAGYEDYRKQSDGQPDRGWYPVALEDLAQEQVRNMVADVAWSSGSNHRIATSVHRFTRGHPGTTRLLLDQFAELGGGDAELGRLLEFRDVDRWGEQAGSVEQRMLRPLLAELPDDVVEDLVTCSASRDLDDATRLEAYSTLLPAARIDDPECSPALWVRTEDGTTREMLPVLRRLLLRRLAAREEGETASWSAVHGWFRHRCAQSGDESGELHHALALGEAEFVARRLAELLPFRPVHGWLELLHAVTAAPNRLEHADSPVEQVRELTAWTRAEATATASLGRLVVALWVAADPLVDHGRERLYQEIAADFHDIAPHSGDGLAVLRDEASRYRAKGD